MNGGWNRWALVISLLSFSFLACEHTKEREMGGTQTAQTEPKKPVFAEITDDPDLPRVLLIGDSISIGYTLGVRELLKGIANVHRIPENGGPTTRGIARIDEWLGDGDWDVIHFNWGLHDLKFMEDGKRQVGLDAYQANLDSLVQKMLATGAKLIWCSTTPVPEGGVKPKRLPEDVARYNDAALDVLKKYLIAIDDLYSFALPILSEIQQPVNVHFTKFGSDALAHCVAASIQLALIQQDIERAALE